ncbi:hypothetical protein [Kribbella sp. NPDC048915]|uniref:hypothetical protein n=1 Tax=Kribbella sp. NPDC048915 TaxID=3155148 RepID=UPI00340E62FE
MHVENLKITIESITLTRRTPTTVTLRTVDRLTGGQLVDRSGRRTALPLGSPTTRLITLTAAIRTTEAMPGQSRKPAWRISTITQP